MVRKILVSIYLRCAKSRRIPVLARIGSIERSVRTVESDEKSRIEREKLESNDFAEDRSSFQAHDRIRDRDLALPAECGLRRAGERILVMQTAENGLCDHALVAGQAVTMSLQLGGSSWRRLGTERSAECGRARL